MGRVSWALFGWVVLSQLGLPFPVSPSLIGAGMVLGEGGVSIATLLAVTVGGTMLADVAWYIAGRWRGKKVVSGLGRLARRSPEWMEKTEVRFRKNRALFLLAAPFLPVNPLASGLAGATGMRMSAYLVCALGSALAWAAVWVGAGYLLGDLV